MRSKRRFDPTFPLDTDTAMSCRAAHVGCHLCRVETLMPVGIDTVFGCKYLEFPLEIEIVYVNTVGQFEQLPMNTGVCQRRRGS